jgi:4-amino-4-deoxy-L-arabinose transferase-like glycosyltransferase
VSIVIRLFFIYPTFSDENFYFNVANIVSEGEAPYKDFFFAHPPLQIYTLALFFKFFGVSFLLGKILVLIISSLTVFLLFLISRELFDEKTAFVTSFILLLTPAFLAFSGMGYGMWEATLLVLASMYFMIKNKLSLASIAFVAAIFFRYLAIIYLPFLILFLYLRKEKTKKFLLLFFGLFLLSFILLFSLFGSNYIRQTVSYQIFSKTQLTAQTQYWGIGIFFFFLALISSFVAYVEKDRILLLLALTPLIADSFILLILKQIFYHYFLISLPFCVMALSRVLIFSKDRIVKLIIPIILFLSIIFNMQTIDFYLNPVHAEKFYYISDFVNNNTSKNDKIFGEPVATNYASFVTGREIAGNYLDSYLPHLVFEGEQKVLNDIEKDRPKLIIEMDGYYLSDPIFSNFISNNYKLERTLEGIPRYSIYILK